MQVLNRSALGSKPLRQLIRDLLGIVQDANDMDNVGLWAVDNQVTRVPHNADGRACSFAAESNWINQHAFSEIPTLPGAGPFGILLEIGKGLFQQRLVAERCVLAKLVPTSGDDPRDVPSGRSRKANFERRFSQV